MSNMNKVAKELKKAMTESDERKPKAYDTEATVARVDGNTLWVKFPGGETETPVRRTIDAKPGDVVMVRVANHRAWTGGNSTNPPTDDTRANQVGAAAKKSIDFVAALSDKDITVDSIYAATGYIDDLYSKNIHTDNIWAATGYIDDLTSKHITTDDLSAATGFIGDLEAGNITANNIVADHATVNNLDVTYAKIADLNAARGRIDNLEANEVVVNDTLKAANADIDYLKSDWISTDRLVLTGNNQNNYPPVQITEAEFNVNKTAYWTKSGDNYIQCTEQSVYDNDTQYYVRQTVKSIIEAINTANTSDPQIVVSNDKLIAASMDVAELSAITADMGTLTAGKIEKGNNFINLNTSPASMEFKNRDSWENSTQGIQFDTQGNLNIKGKVTITAGSNVPTTQEVTDAIDDINIGGRNLVLNTGTMPEGGSGGFRASGGVVSHIDISQPPAGGIIGGIRVTNSGSSEAHIGFAQDGRKNTFIAGEKYTMSCWIRASAAMTRDVTLQPIFATGSQYINIILPQVSLTTSWQKIYAEGLVLRGEQTDTYSCGYVYVDAVPANAYFEVCGLKVEQGNKVTDWSPAPEDIQAELDAKKSVHTLKSGNTTGFGYRTIVGWSAEGDIHDWGVTSIEGVKIGDTVRIGLLVSDMGTASNRPTVYLIGTVTNVYPSTTRVEMISHGLDTTVIDGGNILTNSIGANQIAANSIGAKHLTISDSTNLATANEMYDSSLPTNISAEFLPAISSGYVVKEVATQQYLMVCDYTPNNFKQNDELYYEFYAKGASAGEIDFAAYAYTGTPPTHTYSHQNYVTINLTTTEQFYSGTLKLAHSYWTTAATQYLLGFHDTRSTRSQIYIRKVVIRKKSGGELIVDGTLTVGSFGTTDKNKILNDKIQVGGENLFHQFLALNKTTEYNPFRIPLKENLIAGQEYTIQLWGVTFNNSPASEKEVGIYWGGGSNSLGWATPDSNGYIKHTFTPTAAMASRTPDGQGWFINLYNSPNATSRSMTLTRWKLEKGNKATDWSLSSVDTKGGKNLLRNSADMTHGNGTWETGTFRYSGPSNSASITKVAVYNPHIDGVVSALKITNTTSSTITTGMGICQDSVPNIVAGKVYTVSCWVRASSVVDVRIQAVYTNQGTSTGYALVGKAGYYSGTWSYFSHTGRLPETAFTTASCGYVYVEGLPASGWAEVCGIKVEEGAVATGWSSGEEADASTYITQIDKSGITIHPTSTTNDRIALNANGMAVYKGNNLKANFSDTIHLYGGNGTSPHLYLNSSMVQLVKDSNNYTQVDANGMQVHQNGATVASFGANAVIGKTAKNHIQVTESATEFYKDSTTKIGQIEASGTTLKMTGGLLDFRSTSGDFSIQAGSSSDKSLLLYGSRIVVRAPIETNSNIVLSNSVYVYGSNTSQATRILCGINSSNDYFFGYGSYVGNEGHTYFDGNNVHIRSKNSVAISGTTDITGLLYVSSNIRLKNNTGLQGANTSGAYKTLIYISSSNTVNLGNSDCATYVNGTSFSGSKSYSGSDLRLKHDIIPLDNRSSELIMNLKPFEYKWNEGQEHFYSKGKCFGLGAQEVSKLMDDIGYDPKDYRVVEETPEGYLAICYTELIPHLIYVAQEQHEEIERLKAEIKAIKEAC